MSTYIPYRERKAIERDDKKFRKKVKKQRKRKAKKLKNSALKPVNPNKRNHKYYENKVIGNHLGKEVFQKITYKSSYPEKRIEKSLNKEGVKYFREVRFGFKWFFYDFYLPEHKILIEYDSVEFHDSPSATLNDYEKDKYAKKLGIKMIRIDKYNIKDVIHIIDKHK